MNKRHYEHTLPNIRGSLSNTYYATLFLRFAKEKELATLKQLFLFDATLRSFASRCENEVGMPCGLDALQAWYVKITMIKKKRQ